jgi:hypothetical protein
MEGGFDFNFPDDFFDKMGDAQAKAATKAAEMTSEQIVSEAKNNLTPEHGVSENYLKSSLTRSTAARSKNYDFTAHYDGDSGPIATAAIGDNEVATTVGTPLMYGACLENGTRPHFPPIQAIIDWVHHKGLTGSYSIKTGRRVGGKANIDSEDKSLAYAIALSISRVGTRAWPWLFPAVNRVLNSDFFERALRQCYDEMRMDI